jgi:hypothetical protein
MRARLKVMMAGDLVSRPKGTIVEGDEAVRLCAAGLADPIRDEKVETADKPVVSEKAVRARRSK